MKKILIIVISAILLALGIWGVVALAKTVNNKKAEAKTFTCMYLDDKYVEGDTIIFRVVYFSDIEITSVKYTIDNSAEKSTTVVTGEAKDHENYAGKGKYYVDTKVEIIPSEDLSIGKHLVDFYGYDGEDTRYVFNKDFIVFEIVAQTQNAN